MGNDKPEHWGERSRSLKLEKSKPVDQLPHHRWGGSCTAATQSHPALQLIAARPDLFRCQGAVVNTWRRRNGKTFGPYYRLSYRQHGRQCSVYLGRTGALVEQVRRALQALQQSIARFRLFNRLRRQIRASLRVHKFRVHSLLRPFGLRLKGFEVRGWRISPLSRFRPPRRRWLPRLTLSKWLFLASEVMLFGALFWSLRAFAGGRAG